VEIKTGELDRIAGGPNPSRGRELIMKGGRG
jgi:hypothetical protein